MTGPVVLADEKEQKFIEFMQELSSSITNLNNKHAFDTLCDNIMFYEGADLSGIQAEMEKLRENINKYPCNFENLGAVISASGDIYIEKIQNNEENPAWKNRKIIRSSRFDFKKIQQQKALAMAVKKQLEEEAAAKVREKKMPH